MKKQLLNWGLEHKEAINFDEILKDKDVANNYMKHFEDKKGDDEGKRLENAMTRVEFEHQSHERHKAQLGREMFDVERNMGLKLKKLNDRDQTNGEEEYKVGLLNTQDVARELGEPCDE